MKWGEEIGKDDYVEEISQLLTLEGVFIGISRSDHERLFAVQEKMEYTCLLLDPMHESYELTFP